MQLNQNAHQASPQYPQFRFIEFNKRRQMRGAECARIEIIYAEGDEDCLWMSAGDLQNNGYPEVMVEPPLAREMHFSHAQRNKGLTACRGLG